MLPGQEPPHSPPYSGRARTLQRAARTQRLLDLVLALCTRHLDELLRACVGQFEQQLFAMADRAHSSGEQQRLMTTRERVLRDHPALKARFFNQLADAFTRTGDAPRVPAKPSGNTWHELALVDPAEQELATTLDQIGSRGERAHASVLRALGQRFAVLVAAPPLEGEALPPGPQVLVQAFHGASQPLDLPLDEELLLLRSFDRNLIHMLGPMYAAADAALAGDGILPQLREAPVLRRVPSGHAGDAGAPAEDAPADSAPDATDAQAAEEAAPAGPSGTRKIADEDAIDVLESLRSLLAQHRAAVSGASARGDGSRAATSDELQLALGALQQHLTQVTDKASRELRSAARLHEELLAQLNAGKEGDALRTELSADQGDTVDLVATLFEQLANQLHQGRNARAVLGGLQLPVLRMAVADHGFFEERTHPARQLLDTVATAANEWLDDGDDDASRLLASKLEQLVARASVEPPSSSLYTVLLADIEHQLAELNRKAKAAERRHVEAARGRERLDRARQRASELMRERFADSPPRGLLRALLDRAWSDVLAITLLRHGEDSAEFAGQLAITDQLLGRQPIVDRGQLQQDVESGLEQIGMHTEEALQVAERLLGVPEDEAHAEISSADLARRIREQQRFGEAVDAEAQAHGSLRAPDAAGEAVHPREAEIGRRLRELPFGTWFEWSHGADGTPSRRKLAWYSPMSGRCLFLTRRGQRAGEITLAELAHEMALERIREAPAERGSLLDRAWQGLASMLRQPRAADRAAGEP